MTDLEKKLWAKVERYLKFLKIVPFLRMVAVCNNLAFGKVDERSDIDLFIVAGKGRLFTVRIFVTAIFHILGVRRHGKKVAGRFCLSFFVDDSALDLRGIAIERDIYLAFWIFSMKPVLDDGVSGEFLSANSWIRDYFDEVVVMDRSRVITGRSSLRQIFGWVLSGKFGDFFESRMKRWQLSRAKIKASKIGEDASLMVEDHILKFHNVDRRREYRSLWIKQYGEGRKLAIEKFLNLSVR